MHLIIYNICFSFASSRGITISIPQTPVPPQNSPKPLVLKKSKFAHILPSLPPSLAKRRIRIRAPMNNSSAVVRRPTPGGDARERAAIKIKGKRSRAKQRRALARAGESRPGDAAQVRGIKIHCAPAGNGQQPGSATARWPINSQSRGETASLKADTAGAIHLHGARRIEQEAAASCPGRRRADCELKKLVCARADGRR